MFDVTKEEDEVLISLQQKDMKIHKPRGMGENLTIGFAVFKVYTRNVLYDKGECVLNSYFNIIFKY